MLTIENLKYSHKLEDDDVSRVVSGVSCDSFFAKKGEIICFTGKESCGKTTLAHLIAGIKIPLEGEIRFENLSITNNEKLFKKYVGYLPAENVFYPEMTFMQYLLFINSSYGFSKKHLTDKINWFSNYIDIKTFLYKRVDTSSDIEDKKINLFSSFFHAPKLLILDEPYLNLEIDSKNKLNEILFKLSKDYLVTVLIFNDSEKENEIEILKNIASRFVIMGGEGKIGRDYLTSEIVKSADERELSFTEMIGKYVVL